MEASLTTFGQISCRALNMGALKRTSVITPQFGSAFQHSSSFPQVLPRRKQTGRYLRADSLHSTLGPFLVSGHVILTPRTGFQPGLSSFSPSKFVTGCQKGQSKVTMYSLNSCRFQYTTLKSEAQKLALKDPSPQVWAVLVRPLPPVPRP
jgi:hypothetical protein